MADHNTSGSRDTSAAFAGLIGGAIFIGLVLYTIVLLTNRMFEGHSKAPGSTHAYAEQESLPRV